MGPWFPNQGSNPCPLHRQVDFFFFFLAALGLGFYVQAFCGCSEWGLLFIAVLGLLIGVASLEPRLYSTGSVVVTHG